MREGRGVGGGVRGELVLGFRVGVRAHKLHEIKRLGGWLAGGVGYGPMVVPFRGGWARALGAVIVWRGVRVYRRWEQLLIYVGADLYRPLIVYIAAVAALEEDKVTRKVWEYGGEVGRGVSQCIGGVRVADCFVVCTVDVAISLRHEAR